MRRRRRLAAVGRAWRRGVSLPWRRAVARGGRRAVRGQRRPKAVPRSGVLGLSGGGDGARRQPELEKEMGRAGTGEGDGARQIWRRRCGAPAVGGAGEGGASTGGGRGDGARRPPQLEEKAARQPAEAEKMGGAGRPIRRRRWVRQGRRQWRRCGSGSGGGRWGRGGCGGDGGAAAERLEEMGECGG
ncbi:hypothetical protein PVAP13_7NG296356 [Panicum virgatum]|uniref:Uncharacterized protein n=1 Tax=Panicum virgatum TaxID=38727 RepID=A0A8T0Q059_PANVG|nr:hypothetical protein PVAP13_7NG296356 [Panicum virgatum]